MEGTWFPTVCPHDCPSGCALEVERLESDRIGRVRGAADHPYTAGVVCAKVARYAERVHHPGRLSTPLQRVGEKGDPSGYRAISWDVALDEVAEAFQRAAQTHGPEAVWPHWYGGTMGQIQRKGIDRLTHVMGYSRMKGTICVALASAGWQAGVGAQLGSDPREISETDLLVVWGGNPAHTGLHVMTHFGRARKEQGAKLAVVDVYRTATMEAADMALLIRPGTDGALACAVMHVLFREEMVDRAFLERQTDFPPDLESHLSTRTPEWAAALTGLTVEAIEAFARLIGSTPRTYFKLGYGFTRSRNGAAQMHAVSCLPALTGAWKHKGGGALYSTSGCYGLDLTLVRGLDAPTPRGRELDQSRLGPILLGHEADLQGGPPVTALLIQNTNPVQVCPASRLVQAGLARSDLFTCVHEQFLTETATYADIILPATTFLEQDDLYAPYGHTFLMPGRAVIEPFGESRSNHDLLCALAQRLGAAHRGFTMSAWELVEATLAASNHPDGAALLERRWEDCAPDFRSAHFLTGFGHPDSRFRFAPDWAALGPSGAAMPRLPDHWAVIEEPTPERPFRLVTAPARHFLNSSFSHIEALCKRQGEPTLFCNPEDSAALGVAEGDQVLVGNARGSLTLRLQPFEGLQRGVVVAEGLWAAAAFAQGIGINLLTSPEAAAPAGGAVFHDTAVWIEPCP